MKESAYDVETKGGLIIGGCICGSGVSVPDKGLGRAVVAAWKTQHQDC